MSDNMTDYDNMMNDYIWLCKHFGEKAKSDSRQETPEVTAHYDDMSRRFSDEQRKVLRGYD